MYDGLKFYINGRELSQIPMTQDGYGVYYYSSSKGYYQPSPKDFYKPIPSGYTKYVNGSHDYRPHQLAVDLKGSSGNKITCNKPVKVTYRSAGDGSFMVVQYKDLRVWLVHTYKWATVGTTVNAGNTLCLLAPKSVTGVADHLHIFAKKDYGKTKFNIYDLIVGENSMTKGTRVKFTADTNLRDGDGTKYPKTRLIKTGAVTEIIGGPRTADGYTWFNIKDVDGHTGWAFDGNMQSTKEAVTRFDGSIPKPKTDPNDELQVKVQKLETEISVKDTTIKKLNTELSAINAHLKVLEEENEKLVQSNLELSKTATEWNEQLTDKNQSIKTLEEELVELKRRYESLDSVLQERVTLIHKLEEDIKTLQSRTIVQTILELFGGSKLSNQQDKKAE